MQITFFGAAGGVTGSKHLIQTNSSKILLDCGMFQGHRRQTRELNSQLPFKASDISAVILSHGHLDHCGLLPLLIKSGFNGHIYATPATRDVAEFIMLDSAHIQMQDAEHMNKHHIEGHEFAVPLYTTADVNATIKQFITVPYSEWHNINDEISFKFYDAGHILGSAVTVLEVKEGGSLKRLAFTGDLGPTKAPLLKDPVYINEEVPVVITESTYGNRRHKPLSAAQTELIEIVNRTIANKGKIIVPAFALGRTQEFIYLIHKLTDQGLLPTIPIYVDSPLATKLTGVYTKHVENYDAETVIDFLHKGELPLTFKNLHYTETIDESKQLNNLPGPLIVISASGMCEAGRILHHLINGITNPHNTILITGFQAQHTAGRRLVEGATEIKLFGRMYPVRAQVAVLNELSAHADASELQNYLEHVPGLTQVFLVHGEETQINYFEQQLIKSHPNWKIIQPQMGDMFVI